MSQNVELPPTTAQPGGGTMHMNNAFDPASADKLSDSSRQLVERRAELLGPAYRLFYQEPVQIVRGRGTTLWDADGADYLDAYNNVVSVGHGHPRVVEAIRRQLETLCTHTRYLHAGILDYSAQLRQTLTGRVAHGHTMFTCTGSEANDLAVRIAKYRTGNSGIIVTAEAYHGNSDLSASFSPSLGDNSALGPWVRQVPAPDSYRVPTSELADWFARHVIEAIRDLERHGQGVAALIVDSLFSSDGIYAHPVDALAPAVAAVQRAGGLFVADEVQSGFGRSGDRMWGYQRHDLDPDIVSMGKPMGNGYPVAGIAVTTDAVARFGRDMRYFNTFGGNSVAVAAAQATLDVIEDEALQENAASVGALLDAGLRELQARHGLIGDVRGTGLYRGAEIVSDRATKAPDGATAGRIVNELRARRVLISATGAAGNVLKIRPPLVFSSADADRLLSTLAEVLATL